jgi:hypothetical protein
MARRVVIIALLGVAAGLLWWGASLKADEVEPSAIDLAVEQLVPAADSPGVLRQGEIAVDLAPGWTGVLQVNGVEIPEDQLVRNEPLNRISFQPGEGQEIEQLAPGRTVATAIIWRPLAGESRDKGARALHWEFRVA